MNPTPAAIIRALVRAARPWSLLAAILLYALGGGIAVYLGYAINWAIYWIGQAAVLMLLISSYLLRTYFDLAGPPFAIPRQPARRTPPPFEEEQDPRTAPVTGMDPAAGNGSRLAVEPVEEVVPRVIFFQVAAATLTIGAVMTVLLIAENRLNPPTFLFLAIAFALALLYAVPPFRLVYSGYGELVIAVMAANLFPSLSFLIQAGSVHRLLAMLTFPLTLLYLASELALSLQGYFADLRSSRQTMLVRLGWQRAMTLHNALIALAYVVLAISVLSGLPWRLAWPVFLSLPVGVFQIWQINSIAGGTKPRWRLLGYTALAAVGMAVYFMNLALWTG